MACKASLFEQRKRAKKAACAVIVAFVLRRSKTVGLFYLYRNCCQEIERLYSPATFFGNTQQRNLGSYMEQHCCWQLWQAALLPMYEQAALLPMYEGLKAAPYLQYMASPTKWWLLEAYFAPHVHSAQA